MAFVDFSGPRSACFGHSQDWLDCHSWEGDRAFCRQDAWGFANAWDTLGEKGSFTKQIPYCWQD